MDRVELCREKMEELFGGKPVKVRETVTGENRLDEEQEKKGHGCFSTSCSFFAFLSNFNISSLKYLHRSSVYQRFMIKVLIFCYKL